MRFGYLREFAFCYSLLFASATKAQLYVPEWKDKEMIVQPLVYIKAYVISL